MNLKIQQETVRRVLICENETIGKRKSHLWVCFNKDDDDTSNGIKCEVRCESGGQSGARVHV